MKRKIYLLLLIGIYFPVVIIAQTVSLNTVISVAEAYANADEGVLRSGLSKQVDFVDVMKRNGEPYLYFANMEDGGWVIIPNEERMHPILGYSDAQTLTSDTTDMPPALVFLLEEYMDVIDSIRINNAPADTLVVKNWGILKSGIVLSGHGYAVFPLLGDDWSIPGSENLWRQYGNNEKYDDPLCSHVYNKLCPATYSFCAQYCPRLYAGCTAVAMAQVMRYWQWPKFIDIGSGQQRVYNWNAMPNRIYNNTDVYSVNMIALLMSDCGVAGGMIYMCSFGSAMLLSSAKNALVNTFKYSNNVRKFNKIWHSDNSWRNLMRTELNAGRPVIYQGWKAVFSTNAHTFVVDGYRQNDFNLFHVNFGWGQGWNGNYAIDGFGYTKLRTLLTDLYPDCSERITDINGVTYTTVSAGEHKKEYATNSITLCDNGNNLVIAPDGKFDLVAGNVITLKPGFHAKAGSNVHIRIRDVPCGNYPFSFKLSSPSLSFPFTDVEIENEPGIALNEEPVLHTSLSVFPNPVQDYLSIQFPLNKEVDSYAIHTMIGVEILRENTKDVSEQINVSNLLKGIYLLKVLYKDGSSEQAKFVKK